jgi:hypothetical protein
MVKGVSGGELISRSRLFNIDVEHATPAYYFVDAALFDLSKEMSGLPRGPKRLHAVSVLFVML